MLDSAPGLPSQARREGSGAHGKSSVTTHNTGRGHLASGQVCHLLASWELLDSRSSSVWY